LTGSKKKWGLSARASASSVKHKRGLVEERHPYISIRRQCQLLGLHRSNLYYQAVLEEGGETEENEALMRLLDEQYTETPFYGVMRMTAWLRREGYSANPKRVRRLLRKMGLWAIYPQPSTSKPSPDHRIYPYLLRNVPIRQINQVWSTDITYIRMQRGFCYLVAVIDWFSRYVLSWEVATTLEASFCLEALDRALVSGSSMPEVFNSDQGAQFTSLDFTGRLLAEDISISMDGRGRALDNIFVERLWRSVKQEEVYIRDYRNVGEAVSGLGRYFDFYNHRRLHQSLDYQTPAQVYWQ
jgi:putative transposase